MFVNILFYVIWPNVVLNKNIVQKCNLADSTKLYLLHLSVSYPNYLLEYVHTRIQFIKCAYTYVVYACFVLVLG